MAKIETGDMPHRIAYNLDDIQEYQTAALMSLLTLLQRKGVLTLPEYGKHVLSFERDTTKPAEQLMIMLGRALASFDPDPPSLSVVE